ncbi:hypothetical protein D1BOALGB6SA_10145 [Olavius sp. associated proteobacterium Delta 1]|nr:hypothetical protein D1BOALGB6SA_10145 [Olavius sp. associated proteobacterium Delta 1]
MMAEICQFFDQKGILILLDILRYSRLTEVVINGKKRY